MIGPRCWRVTSDQCFSLLLQPFAPAHEFFSFVTSFPEQPPWPLHEFFSVASLPAQPLTPLQPLRSALSVDLPDALAFPLQPAIEAAPARMPAAAAATANEDRFRMVMVFSRARAFHERSGDSVGDRSGRTLTRNRESQMSGSS